MWEMMEVQSMSRMPSAFTRRMRVYSGNTKITALEVVHRPFVDEGS